MGTSRLHINPFFKSIHKCLLGVHPSVLGVGRGRICAIRVFTNVLFHKNFRQWGSKVSKGFKVWKSYGRRIYLKVPHSGFRRVRRFGSFQTSSMDFLKVSHSGFRSFFSEDFPPCVSLSPDGSLPLRSPMRPTETKPSACSSASEGRTPSLTQGATFGQWKGNH